LRGQREARPASFSASRLPGSLSAVGHSLSSAAKQSKISSTAATAATEAAAGPPGVQRVPIKSTPGPLRFMQPTAPHSRWLSLADSAVGCRLCSRRWATDKFSFCRGGLDWVALGVMCVLYLHIDVFLGRRRVASALLLRVIVLSWSYSCKEQRIG